MTETCDDCGLEYELYPGDDPEFCEDCIEAAR